jgi:hypothetical protein
MSQLSRTNFEAKYGTAGSEFPDNTTGLITELIMRTFGKDLSDSFLSNVNDIQKKTTASGTNTYTVTSGITSYVDGFTAIVKFTNGSSGVCTINFNGLGAKKIYTNPTTQATTGDITANQIYLLVYDSALDSAAGGFAMLGGSSGGGGGSVVSVTGPNVDNTDPTNPITGTIELTVRKTASATLAASDAGKLIEMDVATPNTITFPLNASVAIPINSIGSFVSRDAATSVLKEDPGIIINSSSGTLDFPADPFIPVVWKKIDTDEWYLWNGAPAAGGTAATTTFTPAGNIAATDVQDAIEELDTEKQAALVSGTNIKTVNGTSILGSGDIDLIDDAIVNGEAKAPSQNAVFDALALKADLASPTFTGTPAAPTAADDTNTTQLATTAFVKNATPGNDLYLYTVAF